MPSPEVEDKVRKLAREARLLITQYPNPFLEVIADVHLVFRPQIMPPQRGMSRAA